MKKSKLICLIVALLAAAAVLAVFIKRREDRIKARRAAWDAYLASDEAAPEAQETVDETGAEALKKDLEAIGALKDDEKLSMLFVVSPKDAKKLAEKLAKAGCSSNYDSSVHEFEVTFNGGMDAEQFAEAAGILVGALKKISAHYEGFIFE